VAFSTMLRSSELVALEVADFQPSPDADDGTGRVKCSKTDQAGDGGERYVTADARRHLEAWLTASGITSGPIFTRFNRHGEPLPKALHPNQVALIFKDVAERAGFKEHEIEQIAGHSTRIGAARELGLANYSQVLIQQDGGWKSTHMVGVYTREREIKRGAMAHDGTSPDATETARERLKHIRTHRAQTRTTVRTGP
jgi:integrase